MLKARRRQYSAIDIARYVSALLVVAIHVYPFVDISETFNLYFMQCVCRLAVPFFFVVSGFFFFRKIIPGQDNLPHLKKYLFRLGRIYVIWSILYLPYVIWNYASTGFGWQSILGYVRDFFLTGSYYHLWFLPSLMTGVAIVYFLYLKKGLPFTLKVSLALYGIGYLINNYAAVWQSLPYISILYGFFEKTLVTARDGFFFAPMFLAMGLLLAKTRRMPLKICAPGFVVAEICLILEVCLYVQLGVMQDLSCMFLMLIPAEYFLVQTLLQLRMPYKPVYGQMRQDSLLIYTSHILFVRLFLIVFPQAHLAVYFLTLACSQCFASLVLAYRKKWPALDYLL